MKKLILIVLFLFAVSASTQEIDGTRAATTGDGIIWEGVVRSITAEAAEKVEAEDRAALVKYAAELLRKIAKYQRKLDALKKTLSQVERGELKAHQIPKNCEGCISLGNSNSSLVFVDN